VVIAPSTKYQSNAMAPLPMVMIPVIILVIIFVIQGETTIMAHVSL
jgi:hypothetical protein